MLPNLDLAVKKLPEPSKFIKLYFSKFIIKFSHLRNAYKLSLASSLENSHNLIEAIARNPENANQSTNVNEVFRAVDAVSDADVNSVNKQTFQFFFFTEN